MPTESTRLGRRTYLPVVIYLNAALREKPGHRRLAIGGPGHEEIHSITDGYALHILERLEPSLFSQTFETPKQVDYDAVEVHFGDRIYRTWRLVGTTDDEHVRLAMLALFDLNPMQAEQLRVLD